MVIKGDDTMVQQAALFTIGVEEEHQVIDPQTRELSADVKRILPRAQQLVGDAVKCELMQSQIEIATPICHTLADLHRELVRLRSGIILAAEHTGSRIAACGTHPFSRWRDQIIFPKEHYQLLVDIHRQLILEQVIFGYHIHVGVADREAAVYILNYMRLWLAPLLALTANSPFWENNDTGYASYRVGKWGTVPLSGPPPYFHSREDYNREIALLIATKSIEDARSIYWDIRLSARFPTIEIRVMDVCLTVDEAVTVAGMVRALVRRCYELFLQHEVVPQIPTEILRVAYWRAARYGLEGELLEAIAGRLLPAHELIYKLLDFVRPALEAEGEWQQISEGISRLLQMGNGAMRQREVYKRTGNTRDVVDYVIAQTRTF
jgi:glutamate---cysteine ligase / carboxylate-amine ligase